MITKDQLDEYAALAARATIGPFPTIVPKLIDEIRRLNAAIDDLHRIIHECHYYGE